MTRDTLTYDRCRGDCAKEAHDSYGSLTIHGTGPPLRARCITTEVSSPKPLHTVLYQQNGMRLYSPIIFCASIHSRGDGHKVRKPQF